MSSTAFRARRVLTEVYAGALLLASSVLLSACQAKPPTPPTPQ